MAKIVDTDGNSKRERTPYIRKIHYSQEARRILPGFSRVSPVLICVGAALAGKIGVGLYQDLSMSETMHAIVDEIRPDPAAQAAYARIYPVFEAAYHALLPIYHMLAEVGT